MSDDMKNPCKEIDLGIHDDVEYFTRMIQEVLNVNIGDHDPNLSNELMKNQFNEERKHMRNLYENILRDKCTKMGIDPKSLKIDWNTMKWVKDE